MFSSYQAITTSYGAALEGFATMSGHDIVNALCRQASAAIATRHDFLILSDRGINRNDAPIPALLAVAAVHHHLIR